jgi:Flp pilus assembly protein TadG
MSVRGRAQPCVAPGPPVPRLIGPRPNESGQSLAEFALVLPVLVAILGGIIQFGVIFWAQNTLTQVVRDTGRWAATQQYACSPTPATSDTAVTALVDQANVIAGNSPLIGYTTGQWTATGNTTVYSSDSGVQTAANTEGIEVAWVNDSQPPSPQGCPPKTNQAVWHVTIRINHVVPVFFPGMQYLPGFANNKITLSSTAQFRMEPVPNP